MLSNCPTSPHAPCRNTTAALLPTAPWIVLSRYLTQSADTGPYRAVQWQAKLTMQPIRSPVGVHAATTPTSGSIGPAQLTLSGLPFVGLVKTRPFFILTRRLWDTRSSNPLP